MKPEDTRSMCCRLRIDNRSLEKRGGGLFGSNPLTGSIGVVTINMPRLGFLSRDEDEFIERLEKLMVLAKESLEIKRKILEKFTEKDLYPYGKFYLRDIKKRFNEYWKNHFSTIGLIGMNEACLNLFGENIALDGSKAFTLRVLDFMRDKMITFQEETGNNYNLEATPAEGTSYRLAKIDKEKYPQIICANEEEYREGAEPFYTNSTQLPVNYTDDLFEALDLQDDIQTKYTGGTVFHTFAGESVKDPNVIKVLIRRTFENYHLPYFTFTPTFSICPSHGYIIGEHYTCPKCGEETEVFSRVVGYLRPVKQWNNGKREEFKLRKNIKV
jgi:ribonucleoside-triphosphate reductase